MRDEKKQIGITLEAQSTATRRDREFVACELITHNRPTDRDSFRLQLHRFLLGFDHRLHVFPYALLEPRTQYQILEREAILLGNQRQRRTAQFQEAQDSASEHGIWTRQKETKQEEETKAVSGGDRRWACARERRASRTVRATGAHISRHR